MSSVERVADSVADIRETLPVDELATTHEQISEAGAALATLSLGSAGLEQAGLHLQQAATHLERASAHTADARENLHDYLVAIAARESDGTLPAGAFLEKRPRPMPMHLRRPSWIETGIDEEFAAIEEITEQFRQHGIDNEYFFDGLEVTRLIGVYRERYRGGRPLRILDIGTGAGRFVTGNKWQDGDTVQGLTALDYRNHAEAAAYAPKPHDPRYIIGNAEKLGTVKELLPEYDTIVSRLTIQHLVDGMGAIEQMANRLTPGGLLCIDVGSGIKTLSPWAVRTMLLQQGFQPFLGFDDPKRDSRYLMLIRTSDRPVRFNLGYSRLIELYEEIMGPLDRRDRNKLAWEYVKPGQAGRT